MSVGKHQRTEISYIAVMEQSKTIIHDYTNPASSASFGGVDRLKRSHPNVPAAVLQRVLETQDVYTKHKQVRHKFNRRKVMVPGRNYLWQMDLVILNKLKRYNGGYSYLVNCIDAFSRYAFSIPIKRKQGIDVVEAFKKILESGYGHCKYLEVDDGTEFKNKFFRALLDKEGIKMYSNYSDIGCALVERFNRTIMTRLQKYMTHNKTKRYIDILPDIVASYNASYHRSIKCAPTDVNEYNQMDVWMSIYKDLYSKPRSNSSQFKKGDFVRLKNPKGIFTKGYAPNFSDKTYEISEVLNSIPVTYKLADTHDKILGTFYKEELSKVLV